jgi:CIC family chloride channel protein
MSENGQKPSGSWWRTPRLHLVAKLQQREDQVFLVLALVIGALTGLAVVAFILLTEREGMRLYPAGSDRWRRVLFPVVGSLGIGYLLFRYFPYARGSGVPQTKAALFAREGRITLRTVLGKFFCTSATLASGIPLGREGPSVQVGAGIASVLGRFLGLRPEKVKALLPVGAAAAIAAAFNTPLAAVLFALEEIVGDLHAPMIGSVVLASATSWMVLRLLLGNNPLDGYPLHSGTPNRLWFGNQSALADSMIDR